MTNVAFEMLLPTVCAVDMFFKFVCSRKTLFTKAAEIQFAFRSIFFVLDLDTVLRRNDVFFRSSFNVAQLVFSEKCATSESFTARITLERLFLFRRSVHISDMNCKPTLSGEGFLTVRTVEVTFVDVNGFHVIVSNRRSGERLGTQRTLERSETRVKFKVGRQIIFSLEPFLADCAIEVPHIGMN